MTKITWIILSPLLLLSISSAAVECVESSCMARQFMSSQAVESYSFRFALHIDGCFLRFTFELCLRFTLQMPINQRQLKIDQKLRGLDFKSELVSFDFAFLNRKLLLRSRSRRSCQFCPFLL